MLKAAKVAAKPGFLLKLFGKKIVKALGTIGGFLVIIGILAGIGTIMGAGDNGAGETILGVIVCGLVVFLGWKVIELRHIYLGFIDTE
jgi:hypothetical protein